MKNIRALWLHLCIYFIYVLHLSDNIDTLTLDCESTGDKVWYIEVNYKLVAGFVINRMYPLQVSVSAYLQNRCKTDCTELAYVLKLSIQMFLCLKSATNSSFERQDITLKAVIISLK